MYAAPTTFGAVPADDIAFGEGELAVDRRCTGVGVLTDGTGVGVEAQILASAGTDADAIDGGVEVEPERG